MATSWTERSSSSAKATPTVSTAINLGRIFIITSHGSLVRTSTSGKSIGIGMQQGSCCTMKNQLASGLESVNRLTWIVRTYNKPHAFNVRYHWRHIYSAYVNAVVTYHLTWRGRGKRWLGE